MTDAAHRDFDLIDLRHIYQDGRFPECDSCGGISSKFHESLRLWFCDACLMPSNVRAEADLWELWKGIMLMNAGARIVKRLLGSKVPVWFMDRYKRLGLQ